MELSLEMRRRVRDAYLKGLTSSYAATAEMFGIGRATVGRILRRSRETGDVALKARGGNNPRIVDLEWLKQHAATEPDARLFDRIEAWVATGGRRMSLEAMSRALRAIGWTHKKNSRRARARNRRRSSSPARIPRATAKP